MVIAVGIIGIAQIQDLSRAISRLANVHIPLQNAVFEMKSANSQYAMGIRNYMFWRGAKYLDAAVAAGKLDIVRTASENFDRQLSFYASLVTSPEQEAWVEAVRRSQQELRQAGGKIMAMADRAEAGRGEDKKASEDALSKHLMDFESRLFQLDAFLDDPLQKFNLNQIDRQLDAAEAGRARSVSLLVWSMAIGLFLGAQTAFLIYMRSRREKERRETLMRKVIKLEEEERNNLSSQVHDQMGQDLSALKIYLGLIDKDLPIELKEPREKIEKTKKILDGLMEKTHNISELLRPPELDDLGLVESIAALIVRYEEMTDIRYSYKRPPEEIKLSVEYSLTLYRVVQEALTNIVKHSGAKNTEVFLEKSGDIVRLSVCDDGVGFDYASFLKKTLRRKEDKTRLGLHGLRERIELLGGKFDITAQPGRGTRFEVVLYP